MLDDARRRYYRLTPLGYRVLAAERERLRQLIRSIPPLKHGKVTR
jgi:DNA-binding PadR family transcriptional regulator